MAQNQSFWVLETGKHHNATLDGLRGVAALVVCLGHMVLAVDRNRIPFHGNLSVDFFFILSGFVLAKAYDRRLRSSMTVARFMALRVIRLWPLLVLGTLLGILIKGSGFETPVLAAAIATGLLLLPLPVGGAGFFPLDGPLWSLFYEVAGNLLYAVIARFRWVPAAICGMGAVLLCYITARGHHIGGGFTVATLWAGVARISWGFFAGVMLGRWLSAERLARLPAIPFPVLAMVLFGLLCNLGTGPWYDDLCVLLLFPLIVVLGAKDGTSAHTRKIALLSGALSYPLYVLHAPIVDTLGHFRGHLWIAAPAMFIGVLSVSYAAWRWYDEPVRRWLTRYTRRPLPAAIAPETS